MPPASTLHVTGLDGVSSTKPFQPDIKSGNMFEEGDRMQEPTLFTAFELVLMAMAGLVSFVLFVISNRAKPGSPFADRDESWSEKGFQRQGKGSNRRSSQTKRA
ncbi:hypothetical protein K1718_18485 [Roseibium porphyridii]|uniref:Uncharacterized protein n=1 Tax=Roseibium porphyridii TaxID=2866279 RepID=A0ABY8F076_9HYPH|nr:MULTISPECIES: hypothetical protein [Stappiaceae]WFE88144.1 hypothetical protein K1718_18485 [Roseibium sp. KMA01]